MLQHLSCEVAERLELVLLSGHGRAGPQQVLSGVLGHLLHAFAWRSNSDCGAAQGAENGLGELVGGVVVGGQCALLRCC